ncbi:MAG: UbiD family decarboxylase [Chloroflexi bacterium]|nr:UbiD family decarboxylase [Chloroflexota bacterium]
MPERDLRQWLEAVKGLGQLKRIDGATWQSEIGALTTLNARQDAGPALIFRNIPGYPGGYGVVSCSMTTPERTSLTLNLPVHHSTLDLLSDVQARYAGWESASGPQHRMVSSGPVTQNTRSGKDVNLYDFPSPKWHEQDGGRYIGTGAAVITCDPDTDEVNSGAYRLMVHDEKSTTIHISQGKHGRLQLEKYHARGRPCPIVISLGHDPLMLLVSSIEVKPGAEFSVISSIYGAPVELVREEVTGLPMPASSEIVLAGWCPPDTNVDEGPFGEWVGYYARGKHLDQLVNIERVYYRNNPVILGCPPDRPPGDSTYYLCVMRSAMLFTALLEGGIPDVRGVWFSELGERFWITVSIKQRYAGHAKQAALVASQHRLGAFLGRFVVVVDEDIDPTDIKEVIWAMCTRCDPERNIDILRHTWSSSVDPTIRKPVVGPVNSRAIVDACKPFEWMNEFPPEIKMSPDLLQQVTAKWGKELKL